MPHGAKLFEIGKIHIYRYDAPIITKFSESKFVKIDPKKIDPKLAADRAEHYSIKIPIKEFSRLTEILHSDAGMADVNFVFYRDASSKVVFDLKITADLVLECEDCTQPFTISCDFSDTLQPLSSEELLAELKSDYDTCEIINGLLNLHDVAEDSLLLSLPMRLEHSDCSC